MGAGEVQYINNTSRMTNRLFLLSDYCFGLSYLWILQWLSSLTAGVSDVVEGIGSSVHFFFTILSWMLGWCIHLHMTELSHMSVATVCIDLVYGSFLRMGSLQLSAHICFCFFTLSLDWPPWCVPCPMTSDLLFGISGVCADWAHPKTTAVEGLKNENFFFY